MLLSEEYEMWMNIKSWWLLKGLVNVIKWITGQMLHKCIKNKYVSWKVVTWYVGCINYIKL